MQLIEFLGLVEMAIEHRYNDDIVETDEKDYAVDELIENFNKTVRSFIEDNQTGD